MTFESRPRVMATDTPSPIAAKSRCAVPMRGSPCRFFTQPFPKMSLASFTVGMTSLTLKISLTASPLHPHSIVSVCSIFPIIRFSITFSEVENFDQVSRMSACVPPPPHTHPWPPPPKMLGIDAGSSEAFPRFYMNVSSPASLPITQQYETKYRYGSDNFNELPDRKTCEASPIFLKSTLTLESSNPP